jgi:hypothetical protein
MPLFWLRLCRAVPSVVRPFPGLRRCRAAAIENPKWIWPSQAFFRQLEGAEDSAGLVQALFVFARNRKSGQWLVVSGQWRPFLKTSNL